MGCGGKSLEEFGLYRDVGTRGRSRLYYKHVGDGGRGTKRLYNKHVGTRGRVFVQTRWERDECLYKHVGDQGDCYTAEL